MTVGQERVGRENDFAEIWQRIEELLIAKCEPGVYAEIVPLAQAMFTAIDWQRAQLEDRTFGEAYRLGRVQGRAEAERDLSRTIAIKDDIINTLSRGYLAEKNARVAEAGSVDALATALQVGDWGKETH